MQNTTSYQLPAHWYYYIQNLRSIGEFPPSLSMLEREAVLLRKTPSFVSPYTTPYPFISFSSPTYPTNLKKYCPRPPVLFYRGNLSLLQKKAFGVVGTRQCSVLGQEFAKEIAQFLNKNGISTISGLAYGIDALVHEHSLSQTIGIMPCGLNSKLPPKTAALCEAIIEQDGLLLSEYLPHQPPRKWRFLHRNRLIAWLCDELILVEAPQHSGALHTVRFALQQHIPVWVVPSSPLTQSNQGGLELLDMGLRPLISMTQLASHLGINNIPTVKNVMSASEFAKQFQLNIQEATKTLMKLQLNGKIKPLSNGSFVWTSPIQLSCD